MRYKCKIEITDDEGYNAIIQGDMIEFVVGAEFTKLNDELGWEVYDFPITKTFYKVCFDGTPQTFIPSEKFPDIFVMDLR